MLKHYIIMEIIKYYIRILIILLAVTFSACTDLDEKVFDQITEENFSPTENDIPRLIAPTYTGLRWFTGCCYDYISMQEGAGDSYITPARENGWGGPYLPYHYHQWTSNHSHVTNGWDQLYNTVNTANRVLYQVENTVDVPENLLPGLIAELRAIRAYAYYHLMDNYGSVPIVTDFTSEELPVQSTRQEVFDFVVQELTDAIPLLSENADQSTYGRMHRWAAIATLARVYLNAEVYTGTPEYDKVIALTDEIINSGLFQLESGYRGNFSRTNHLSSEMIFVVPYDEVFATGNNLHMRTLAPVQQQVYQMGAQPWGGSSATPQFIDTYDEDDARLDLTWSGGPQYDNQGRLVIDITKDVPSMEATEYHHGYKVNKYEIYAGMLGASDVDLPLFRYTMILMMKAEALLRTGSADQAASIVTQVRERAFADTDPSKAEVTGAELMQGSTYNYGYWENGQVVDPEGGDDIMYGRFLDELGWEFAVEGFRRQDLIRFGAFSKKSWFNKRPSDPCKTIFPIPLRAMETNTNLVQHPCYQ